MAVLTKAEIAALSTEERLALIDDIWDSFEAPPPDGSLDDLHRQIIEERLADCENSPDDYVTLEQFREELQARQWNDSSSPQSHAD